MPTPARTSRPELTAIALRLVEQHGLEALTVSAVARAAGIRGPSVYKHFTDREALVTAVQIEAMEQLGATLRSGTVGSTPRARLISMAASYRGFALQRPHLYASIYSRSLADQPELAAASKRAAQPLFEELRRARVPEDRLRPLSRTLTAFLHGFVSMQIVNAFRLGGDLEHDFEASLATILAGLD